MKIRLRRAAYPGLLAAWLAGAGTLRAQFTDFMSMDLEALSYVRITTLGRTENALLDYPAAATVLSSDDILRTGAITLADALRDVPGMQVARINAFYHAISVRGFNDNTANKLLVVADGRSLHDGTFSGTNWGLQEMILADLDRIEVLRGPGATLWGANAMNGFINVVSKSAHDTLGLYLSGAVGDHLNDLGAMRYGWRIDDRTAARVYFKTQSQDGHETSIDPRLDDWRTYLAGSRLDRHLSAGGDLTLIAEWRHLQVNGSSFEPVLAAPYRRFIDDPQHAEEFNLSSRWQHPLTWADGEVSTFASLEYLRDHRVSFAERRTRFTFDLQAKFRPRNDHRLLTGITYDRTDDQLGSTGLFTFADPSAAITFIGAFAQDEFDLLRDRLRLTVGAKIERNSYSGAEFQPSARLIWAPAAAHRFWAAWSHAARTPTRAETSVNYFAFVAQPTPEIPLPIAQVVVGSPDMTAEQLTALELGYRFQPTPRLLVELTSFYNDYSELRGLQQGVAEFRPSPLPHVYSEFLTNNEVGGHTRGGEFSVRWQVTPTLRAEGSLSRVVHDLVDTLRPDSVVGQYAIDLYRGGTPEQETRLRLAWDPHPAWRLDAAIRHAGPPPQGSIPGYTGLDLGLTWRPYPDTAVTLIGTDLLRARHREFADIFSQEVTPNLDRSVMLRITHRL